MSLQFILGSSGAGKSQYIYNRIIAESMENPSVNYILLVPEQYSMALQRKMVMLHPHGGTMNIDVIGFNRLAYRVFDELSIKTGKVLEDFGKTMLIRQVAGSVSGELSVFGGCLDKPGFIDEVKSLMSEMYQYDISRNKLLEVIDSLTESGQDELLLNKLKDMTSIFRAFEEKINDEYIVAEQLTELLAECVEESELIANSVIVMDGFTGFTPIQLKLIERLMARAKKIYTVLTIDRKYYEKKYIAEHELFYLTSKSMNNLKRIADTAGVVVEPEIFIDLKEGADSAADKICRWDYGRADLLHLEKNLFRYPYEKYAAEPENIKLVMYDNPRRELIGVAHSIRELVMKEGYRYKDFAVISGNLEGITSHVEQIFPLYEIPYFLDYSRPVKNNPFIDALGHALRMVEDNFSYDSVFAFLKSGALNDVSFDDIEALENYVLSRGIRGIDRWKRKWKEDVEDTRQCFMDVILPFYDAITVTGKKPKVVKYVESVRVLMDRLFYESRMSETAGLYDRLQELLDKMQEIMGSESVSISEFNELMDLGLKDLSLGMIPSKLDMTIVGDITRTRLDEIKVLYIIGVNDGIIPMNGISAQIISDREKDRLEALGFSLAPTDKLNSYIEQFYLYINMTKPSDKLYLSYTIMDNANDSMRPSYIIGRVKNLFPKLDIIADRESGLKGSSRASGFESLVQGIQEWADGDYGNSEETLRLCRLYAELGDTEHLDMIKQAMCYSNIPESLSGDVVDLIQLRLMSQSVSRLEQFADCAYSYFLQHTLGLKERDINGIDNRNIGNILHSAMERMYRHVHDNMDNDWTALDDLKRDELITGFVERAFDEEYLGLDASEDKDAYIDDSRCGYVRNMLVRIGRRTAEALCRITSGDSLVPEYFEYKFSEELPLGEDGRRMKLRGVIDRADVYYSPETSSLRLRIIDYKSGNHDFKISRLYEGLQLQLAVYMNIMTGLADSQYNRDRQGEDRISVVPEGMYYYQMCDPFVEAEDGNKAEAAREKALKLKGLVNTDDEYFSNIIKYAMKKVKDIAADIAGGDISKNPVVRDMGNACDYCAYSSVCRFDDKNGGNKFRFPRYKESEKDKVYEEIVKQLGGEPDGMD